MAGAHEILKKMCSKRNTYSLGTVVCCEISSDAVPPSRVNLKLSRNSVLLVLSLTYAGIAAISERIRLDL